jgi:O-antigen/teichoic acid export membrane protein
MHAEITSTGRRAFDAGAWAIGSRIVAKAIDLVLLLCLARLVGPDQFGLVAIAMAVVFVVEALFELPVAATLIRVDALTPDRLHTAFTLGLLRGLVVAAMLVLLAVPLAAFSEEPRLVALLAVLSLAPACRGMASPRLVEYNRAFDPRPDAAIELGGKAVAFAVALAVAAATHSYWAIAAATVCGPLAGTVLSYIVAPLRPRLTLVE